MGKGEGGAAGVWRHRPPQRHLTPATGERWEASTYIVAVAAELDTVVEVEPLARADARDAELKRVNQHLACGGAEEGQRGDRGYMAGIARVRIEEEGQASCREEGSGADSPEERIV